MRRILISIFIHAAILWAALSLGYNSYKEYMRYVALAPLAQTVRDSVKALFPWAILIFSGVYLIVKGWMLKVKGREKMGIFLTTGQYGYVITFYAILLNLFFFSEGRDILIPMNLSVFYFVILLFIFFGVSKLIDINYIKYSPKAQEWLPPIIYRFLITNLPKAQTYINEKPPSFFIIASMILLMLCAFLLIFKAEKVAEQLANIAYFSLVIGVGIELYRMIKYGEQDTGDNEH